MNFLEKEVKVKIGVSAIEGVGVIAIRDIKKGEKIGCYDGMRPPRYYKVPYEETQKLSKELRDIIMGRWGLRIVNGESFRHPNDDALLILFVNHSFRSINYNVLTDTATREIRAGEEVFQDYTVSPNYDKVYPWIENLKEG